jgi:hypothetical protein
MKQIPIIEPLKELDPELSQNITSITDQDRELITSYLFKTSKKSSEQLNINFEDSFEYIRLYFSSGPYIGFKYLKEENLIIFAIENPKKPHFKVFKPLGKNVFKIFPKIISALSTSTKYPIQVVCLSNKDLKDLNRIKDLMIKNIKEFKYYIYDLSQLGDLSGNIWKNVRQKVNQFNHYYPKVKTELLNIKNCSESVHFIGAWRRELLNKRGYSYANLDKNKYAVNYYADKNDLKNIWAYIYRLKGRIVAVQLLYRLGADSAAHVIGLADTEIKGLAEATQVDTWKNVFKLGIRYINDGASWRPGLEQYKRKFNPISFQRIFECKLKSK